MKKEIVKLRAEGTFTMPQRIQDVQINDATVTFHFTILKVKRGVVTIEIDSPALEGDVTIIPDLSRATYAQ